MENINYFPSKASFHQLIVFVICTVSVLLSKPEAWAQLPTQFQKVELVTGLKNSVNMEFAPDGRIFILDRYGELLIYKPTTQTTVSAGILDVFHDLEDGLIGIAFDPQFHTNNFIYLHYSPASTVVNRISRFQMNGDVLVKSSEKVVLQWPTQRLCCYHSAGDLEFDSQGNLYIATGDNTNHSEYATLDENNINNSSENTSSNSNDLRGKILRIKPTSDGNYTIPVGNLFPNGVGGKPEIYVMGARNPFKIFVDKANNDWLYWGDVGPDANFSSNLGPMGMDEINLTKTAGNYGWPYFSGKNEPYLNTYANPNFYYDPASPKNISKWNTGTINLPPAQPSWLEFFHESYMAGPRYYFNASINNPKKLPSVFDGVYFYFDFNKSKVWAVKMDQEGKILSNEQLAPTVVKQGGFIDMKIGPDGQIYILQYGSGCCPTNVGTGALVRLDYLGVDANLTPEVVISVDKTSGSLPLTVNFSSAGTNDSNGDPLIYEWDFQSDGIVDSNAKNPSFTYNINGVFDAQLRVSDGKGGVNSKSIKIYAGNHAATFNFISPPDGGMINWGDQINYIVQVNDIEDGATSNSTINCNRLSLIPSFGHLTHFHDGLTINKCEGSYVLDPIGHDTEGQAHIFMVFNANYTDNHGLTSYDQIRVHPKRMEAEFYDLADKVNSIINTDPLGGGTHTVRASAHNSYIVYQGRNLLNISKVSYRVASTLGGTIDVRNGSPSGAILSTVQIPVTGSINTFTNVEANISNPGGKNDLYLVFKRNSGDINLFDLNSVEFIGNGASIDNTPPKLNILKALSPTQVSVKFDEPLDKASAENIANYTINNGIKITSASLQGDKRTVYLTTSTLATQVSYLLTINNIKNLNNLGITSGISKTFVFENILVRINTGGEEFLNNGDVWLKDQYNSSGIMYANIVPIANTDLDEIYQSERNNLFTYDIPVPNPGKYDVSLHFAEIHFGVNNSKGVPGSRVFNVNIENNQASLINYDIIERAGAPATAIVEKIKNIEVLDGKFTIKFTAVIDKPKISAIEISYSAESTVDPTCPDTEFPNKWNEIVIGSELPYRAVYIFSEDMDGDGFKDIVTGGWWYKNPGTPTGSWIKKEIGAPLHNMSLIHDFDNDGDLDIFGTQGQYIGAELAWAENDGNGNFTIHTNIPAGTSTYPETFMAGAALGNFNNVANTQIAITWNGAESIDHKSSMQMLTVPADPKQPWTITSISPNSKGEAISAGDIDGDGDLDIFQASNWLRNDNGTWTTFPTKITLPSQADRNALVDIDNNGKLDGIVTYLGLDKEISWFQPPSNPINAWSSKTIGTGISAGVSLGISDMDFDGDLDIIVGEWKGSRRLLSFENDLCNTGTWIQHVLHPGGLMDHHDGAQTVDLDNDGDLDIISIGWDKRIPRIYINQGTGSNNTPPTVEAGTNKTLTLPTNSTTLTAQASDADGNITSYSWQQVSGPSQATLSNANTATVTVSDLVAGTYNFKVTVADNNEATASDQVVVTVNGSTSGGNEGDLWLEAECASILGSSWVTGSNIEASNGNYLMVKAGFNSASVAPTGSGAITSFSINAATAGIYKLYGRTLALSGGDNSFWIRINGGSWNIWNLTVGSTFIWNNFSSSGISLNAGANTIEIAYREDGVQVDKFFLTQSSITPTGTGSIASNCGGGTTNTPPTVEAGTNKTLTLPTNSTTLTAQASDANGSITSYSWQQVSGPSQATLINATSATVTVSDLVAGTYNFKVSVIDNDQATASDQVAVTVNESTSGGSGDDLWLEAECASILGSSWVTGSNGEASNGNYIMVKAGFNSTSVAPTGSGAITSFSFDAPAAGTYKLFGRTLALSGGDNSFWIRINGGSWNIWNLTVGSTFIWNNFSSSGITLNSGANTIEIAYREDGVQVDKFFLTQSSTIPVNIGGIVYNCPEMNLNTLSKNIRSQENSEYDNFIVIYPNPTTDIFKVHFQLKEKETLNLSLSDKLGKQYFLGKYTVAGGSSEIEFSLQELQLPTGIYFIKIDSNQLNQLTYKILKK